MQDLVEVFTDDNWINVDSTRHSYAIDLSRQEIRKEIRKIFKHSDSCIYADISIVVFLSLECSSGERGIILKTISEMIASSYLTRRHYEIRIIMLLLFISTFIMQTIYNINLGNTNQRILKKSFSVPIDSEIIRYDNHRWLFIVKREQMFDILYFYHIV